MSSSGKTPNIQLNQWVASDPVCREDFNADNAKIDAAFEALPTVKLMDLTTNATASQVDLELSDLNLSQYSRLILDIVFNGTKAQGSRITLNNVSASTRYERYVPNNWNSVDYMQTIDTPHWEIYLWPGRILLREPALLWRTGPQHPIVNQGDPLRSINIKYNFAAGYESSTDVPAGTRIQLWGVKK